MFRWFCWHFYSLVFLFYMFRIPTLHPQHLKQNMVAFEWDNSNFINDKDDKKLFMIPPIPFWGIQIVSFTSQLLLLILSAAYIPTMKHRFIRPIFYQSNYLSISLIFYQKFNEKRSGNECGFVI